jgi:hypothetical protein
MRDFTKCIDYKTGKPKFDEIEKANLLNNFLRLGASEWMREKLEEEAEFEVVSSSVPVLRKTREPSRFWDRITHIYNVLVGRA